MKRARFTEERTSYALRQPLGCSEASFYVWKKRYGNLGMMEVKELRQLRDENTRQKRLVGDLTCDKYVLARPLNPGAVSDRRDSFVSAPRTVAAAWSKRNVAKEQSGLRLRIRGIA